MARIVHSQDPQKYNITLAAALKDIKELKAPEWVSFVKSGVSKERVPADADFWYIRTASVLRQLYIQGVVGVEKLRTRYGGKKNRGGRRSKFMKSSGKLIRVILQQCETAGLVEKMDTLQHGRRLTEKGRLFLDGIKVKEDIVEKKEETKKEAKVEKAEAQQNQPSEKEIKTEDKE